MNRAPQQQAKAPVAPTPRAAQLTVFSKAPARSPSGRLDPWAAQRTARPGGHSALEPSASAESASQRSWPAAADTSQGRVVLSRSIDSTPLVQRRISPDKTSDQEKTSAGGSATSFDGLKALIGEIAGGVKTGQFTDASFKVAIPVAQVPGLSITVDASGSFLVDSKQQKELKLKLGVGVKYALGKLFNVNANFNESVTLRGDDLGAALVDAIKQTTYWALETAGVHARFAELVELAKEGPGFWDYAKLTIPVYGTYQAAKLAISSLGAENLIAAHEAFVAFFQNDAGVGFEASLGAGAGGGVKAGDQGASGTLEARAGLEDVNNEQTRGFTELAGEVAGNKGNSAVRVRFAKRFRQGGKRLKTIEVQSALSMPKKAYDFAEGEKLMRNASMLWSIVSVFRALEKAESGGKIGDSMGLVHALLGLGSNVFGNNTSFDSLMGLDIKVTETDGKWTVNYARIKLMTQIGTGTGVSVGGVEANVRVGKFFDVGGVLELALTKYAGGEP